ncbi:MAG TPA: hypothetical protein VLK85_04265 [Ramlibacter sp.]|nr:hypothetical protein [Ramlibacter sp.]
MSKRNGPHALGYPAADDRRGGGNPSGSQGGSGGSSGAGGNGTQRYSRAEYAKLLALQDEVQRADGDYQRLRNAYLDIAREDPTHEVALAMIGHDMDRAHARLQALIGLPRLPFTHEPSTVMRREAQRLVDDKH